MPPALPLPRAPMPTDFKYRLGHVFKGGFAAGAGGAAQTTRHLPSDRGVSHHVRLSRALKSVHTTTVPLAFGVTLTSTKR